MLRRRGVRFVKDGDARRGALALRESAAITGHGSTFVLLGHALTQAKRSEEALDAFKQALWIFRRDGADGRVRSVAHLILAVDPSDQKVARMLERAA